jgi:hypothetical protein
MPITAEADRVLAIAKSERAGERSSDDQTSRFPCHNRQFSRLAKAGNVLIPALIFCVGLIGFRLYRRQHRDRRAFTAPRARVPYLSDMER